MGKIREKESSAESVSGRLDRELAALALQKRRAGKDPTRQELAALRRVEKARDEEQRWDHYRSIPQKHWRLLSGRPAKVLHEQADRYGIAFGGAQVDLTVIVPQFHAFLARNAKVLERADAPDPDDPALFGPDTPSLERLRFYTAELRRMDFEERQKTHLPRDVIHTMLGELAAALRDRVQTLDEEFGVDAGNLIREALDDTQRIIQRTLGSSSDLTDDLLPPPTADADPHPARSHANRGRPGAELDDSPGPGGEVPDV